MNSDINSPLLVESTIPLLRGNVPTKAQYIFGVNGDGTVFRRNFVRVDNGRAVNCPRCAPASQWPFTVEQTGALLEHIYFGRAGM